MKWTSPVSRAALLVGAEGAGLAVLGVGYATAGVVGAPFDRTATLLEGALVLGLGLLLTVVARALAAVRSWARSPAVVVQLLALPVGVGLAQAQVWAAAVPVLLLAGAVLYLLATPEARLAFRGID